MSQGVHSVERMFDLLPLGEAADKVADLDPALSSGTSLMSSVLELETVIRALEAARSSWLGELDRQGTTDEVTGHRTATWFANESNCARGPARRHVRAGRRLVTHLEQVHAAFAQGSVSADHVQVLTDLCCGAGADTVAACQTELLALAQVLPFERWKAEVRGLIDLADGDGRFRPGPDGSTLRLTNGFGGSLEMAGTLVGEDGAVLRDALGRAADRLALRYRREVQAGARDSVPARAVLLAEALVDLVRRGTVAGHDTSGPVTELTLVAQAHDPLGTHGTHRDSGLGPDLTPSPVRPLGDVVAGTAADLSTAMSDATARTLCCDPVLRTVVLDSLGNPVDLGRRTRLVPPGLRRALEVRDGGCVFPGCDAPASWCDAHHVVHWADGGPTSAQNLASLCRHHHGVTHRNGWSMTADHERAQRFTWTRPDGTVLHSQRQTDHPPATSAPPPPAHSPPRE